MEHCTFKPKINKNCDKILFESYNMNNENLNQDNIKNQVRGVENFLRHKDKSQKLKAEK